MQIQVLKYLVYIALAALIVYAIYAKGCTDTANKYELKIKEEQLALVEKLAKVADLSNVIASNIEANAIVTNSKLDNIYSRTKGKPLTTAPCQPSSAFTNTWVELNAETK